jgi:hypothetical protein
VIPTPRFYWCLLLHCLATVVYIAVARHWLVSRPWLASALFTATRLLPSNRHNT